MKNQIVLKIIDEYFKKQQISDKQIFQALRLYIFTIKSGQHESDLHILAKILDPEALQKVIEYFNGDVLRIPKKAELLESTFLTICFYLKEVKGWNWIQIREFINLPESDQDLLSSISIGKQINGLKEEMGRDILELIRTADIEGLSDMINEVQL